MGFLRQVAKDAYFWWHRTPLGDRASVLSYHHVGKSDAFFAVSPEAFERQLAYIQRHDFCTTSLSDLIERIQAGTDIGNCVVLTFNDGYKSFYTDVFPVLKRYSMPATLFVSVEFLDTSIQTSDGHVFQTLSVAEIREMIESGLVEVMPQAQHRVALHHVAFDAATAHMEAARKNVEALTKKNANIFSFSKGRPTERFAEYMKDHDWMGAVSVHEGLVYTHTSPYFIPRNAINSKTTWTQFVGKLSGAVEEYAETRKRF